MSDLPHYDAPPDRIAVADEIGRMLKALRYTLDALDGGAQGVVASKCFTPRQLLEMSVSIRRAGAKYYEIAEKVDALARNLEAPLDVL
ncbi:MAG: hypothetical protein KGL39_50830 [Patescibacteria group bacterium]|nr:hypothetical protein [Patescibacteria group bacterium]